MQIDCTLSCLKHCCYDTPPQLYRCNVFKYTDNVWTCIVELWLLCKQGTEIVYIYH